MTARTLPSDDEARQLLTQAITISGLSTRQFAMQVLTRDERTMRRWIAGDLPIPIIVREKLASIVAAGSTSPP